MEHLPAPHRKGRSHPGNTERHVPFYIAVTQSLWIANYLVEVWHDYPSEVWGLRLSFRRFSTFGCI
jgi:hypothetical protein